MDVVRCVSCEGYGWLEDEDTGETSECGWCGGIGYVYRTPAQVDQKIPFADLEALTQTLEHLEHIRLHEMGYSGQAKKPWEQKIRQDRGDRIARDLTERENDES